MGSKKLSKVFMAGGLLLVAAALCLVIYNCCEDAQAAGAASKVLQELYTDPDGTSPPAPPAQSDGDVELLIPDYIRDPEMPMPTEEIDGESYIGVVSIPSLSLRLPVISQWSYPRLKIAPCRYRGSAYLNDLIIAAHNYQSHFGALVDIKIGDQVYFTDMARRVFVYEVIEVETLGGSAVESMVSGDWDLTLFTCTVGGKTRVTVRCARME